MRQLFERLLLEAAPYERDRWLAGPAALATEVVTGAPPPASTARSPGPSVGDSGYAWQHGLYWLASNVAADSPLVLVVDDLQWCDAPSARALAFIARRLEGQPVALMLGTRPLDPVVTPEASTLLAEPAVELLHLSPLSGAAVGALIAVRLSDEPHRRFVQGCLEATGGNPFLVGELLDEAAARGLDPAAAAAAEVATMVPHGVANAVLLRLARLSPAAAMLARALSVLGDGAQVGDAARLAGLAGSELEEAMAALVSAGVVQSGATARFVHPILRAAIYGDLSPAGRERLHHSAAGILRERGAPAGRVAAQVMHTEPAGDSEAVALLRDAAREALALGDAAGAAALLARALDEPPSRGDRAGVLLGLGQARARAGNPEAIAALTDSIAHGDDPGAIAAAAVELGGMLFFAGRARDGAAILRRAQERLPTDEPARDQVELALLNASDTSASARAEAEATIARLRDPGGPATNELQATTLAIMAMDEVMFLGAASTARDFATRALAAKLPLELHRSGNWAILALAALALTDELDAALRGTDEILARARHRGAALTVVTISSLRANFAERRGDLATAEADAQAAIELAPDLLGTRFLVLAWGRRCWRVLSAARARSPCAGSSNARAFATTASFLQAASCATRPPFFVPRQAITKRRSRRSAAARWIIRHSVARILPRSPGARRPPFPWPSSAVTRRPAPWPPRRCVARVRSARRARSGSPCAPKRSSALRRNGREDWRRRSRCSRPRPRGSNTRACSLTWGRRFARVDSAPGRGSRCSRGLRWRAAAALVRWNAGRRQSWGRLACDRGPRTTPARTR
jgi:tetratricopeptide (TPR) repeat protein